jgi:hypothetical protein
MRSEAVAPSLMRFSRSATRRVASRSERSSEAVSSVGTLAGFAFSSALFERRERPLHRG